MSSSATDGCCVTTSAGTTPEMKHIDYGVALLRRRSAGTQFRPTSPTTWRTCISDLVAEGRMAGYEVTQRFYEIGSPAGLEETRRRTCASSVRVTQRMTTPDQQRIVACLIRPITSRDATCRSSAGSTCTAIERMVGTAGRAARARRTAVLPRRRRLRGQRLARRQRLPQDRPDRGLCADRQRLGADGPDQRRGLGDASSCSGCAAAG